MLSRFLNEGSTERQENVKPVFWKGKKLSSFDMMAKRPRWCANKFITTKHINTAQERIENVQRADGQVKTREKSAEGENESDRYLALSICSFLFTLMTSVLTRERESCKINFF